MSSASIFDSAIHGHLWAPSELRERLGDRGRIAGWLEVLAALARAQAEHGVIPADAADAIASTLDASALDLDAIARATQASGHSTAGLIEVCRGQLPERAREFFYYGATVQDVTDTWSSIVVRDLAVAVARELRALEGRLLELAEAHRATVMLGRTHAQPGAPTTLGLKLAVWLAEVRRHVERLIAVRERVAVAQLAGAVGTSASLGTAAPAVRRRFAELLGLAAPEAPWLTARDRVIEFACTCALVTGTLAKAGNEVKQLQRPEIGELTERNPAGTVGSITMPHKRNPEGSEQLGTLARVVRACASAALEGAVHEHERDGTAWKTEWWWLPECCMATAAAVRLATTVIEHLDVDVERMRANIDAMRGYVMSETVMLALAERTGKHIAHEAVYAAAMDGQERGLDFRAAIAPTAERLGLDAGELDRLLAPELVVPAAAAGVDEATASVRARRAGDPPWLTANGPDRAP
jgi:adenylosuccinate lyase